MERCSDRQTAPGRGVRPEAARTLVTLAMLVMLAMPAIVACGDDGPGDLPACLEGFRADGPACVPIFDDPDSCPGPAEMPVLGGGCRPVGVPECVYGFSGDGEGGCEPVLPPGPEACPPGTMELLNSTTCQPVGVLDCAEGFVSDAEGGCEAILPPGSEPCPPGTIAQIGHDTCQPLGDCGPEPSQGGSPWGLIVTDSSTVYVDASADATGANGTAAAPFPTVGAALAAAPTGGVVAIAAGEYEEVLVLSRPVRLEGRCSTRVTLRGRIQLGQPRAALNITTGGSGSEVRGVTLTGPGVGLEIGGAEQVVVEEVEVADPGGNGVLLVGGAEATLRRVKVTGSTLLGAASQDSALRLEQSVVRDTRSDPGTNNFGRGIVGQCTLANACGSVHVEGTLVVGNRDAGLFLSGVEATLLGSVVMDTLPRETDQRTGRGINAQCNETLGTCTNLRIESSLVTGNREMGLYSAGADVTVTSSVVRDTLPQQRDEVLGRGISVECNASLAACGSLQVERSRVSGNREAGISAFGVATTVRESVVENTLSRLSDHSHGRGIAAQCDPLVGACGSLQVEFSLVSGNRDVGIFAAGPDTEVLLSTVRDTLSQESDQRRGRGISSQCDEAAGACRSLHVESCLVWRNRDLGIFASGADVTVLASVVRGTLPQEEDGTFGNGINAQCHLPSGVCGTLRLEGSLLEGNHEVGLVTWGMDTIVVASVVRDTQPKESDGTAGVGISAQCDPDLWTCGILRVEESLVRGNRDVGIMAWGTITTVVSTAVWDTLPRESDLAYGRGINAQCDPGVGVCGTLRLESSLVGHSEDVGVFLFGVPAELQDVAVIDTRPNTAGPWEGTGGHGIWAFCDPDVGSCGTFSMNASLIWSSHAVGLALEGISGSMTSSAVLGVLAQPADGKYGYGVQVAGREDGALPTFHVRECHIGEAKLVGVLYYRAQGTLSRSAVAGAEYSVAMNEGSSPTIARDNQLSGTVSSDPQWVSLTPSPAPPPTTPLEPAEESP